ncbi:MAG: hypothetical protein HZB16_04070 [Armatimonadetes bacterium]|nr:hypothetical protein [Armatimonadota bacterium]
MLPTLLLCANLLVAGPVPIPRLNWQPRSDWVTVKATADGVADDTAAIQAGLAGIRDGSTLYLPPGTYRVTKTLTLTGPLHGVTLLGAGRDTRLVWAGEPGGRLFVDDGVAYSRFVGLVFDGQGKASVGFCHASDHRFETEVRHQYLAFVGFTDAGVLREPAAKFSTAETLFENCYFADCKRGAVLPAFNDYDWTFDRCQWEDCETGVACSHGNFYIRNCRFERSREVDISAGQEHGSSVRRTVSVGSKRFLSFGNGVAPMTLEDCRVQGWTATDGAVRLFGAPALMFDCAFTRGPAGSVPVQTRGGQQLVVSGNTVDAGALTNGQARLHEIPAGSRQGNLKSADQRFISDQAPPLGRVFDAKADFGAKGDGQTDDTAAIARAIDAARAEGRHALAYLPSGTYIVSQTLNMTGADYAVGGSGWCTRLVWRGAEGGTMISVKDPQRLVLEHLNVGSHDAGAMNNGIDIEQTGTGAPSRMTYDGVYVFGMYQKQPFRKGLVLRGLGPEATVVMPHVQGNQRLVDCARATILGKVSYEGSITVEGKATPRDGLIGYQTRLATLVSHVLYVRDSQSVVMSDFYVEQSESGFVLEGQAGDPAGRVTISSPKVHFNASPDPEKCVALTVRGYHGQVTLGPTQFYIEPKDAALRFGGASSVSLCLLAPSFYNTRPVVTRAAGATAETARYAAVGTGAVIPQGDQVVPNAEWRGDDVSAEAALPGLSAALDDFRRLGAVDLAVGVR